MNLVLLFLASETACRSDRAMRDVLMRIFFDNLRGSGKQILSAQFDGLYERKLEFPAWKGVTIEAEKIIQVRYYKFPFGNFNLWGLPHSVTRIGIESCQQNFQIDIRSLPRCLLEVDLSSNRIFGIPDLTLLPSRIEIVNFSYNLLEGPICLRNLPRWLSVLNMSNNRINQEKVFYADLPESLHIISLLNEHEKPNIQEICAVPLHAEVDCKIFEGFSKNNCH